MNYISTKCWKVSRSHKQLKKTIMECQLHQNLQSQICKAHFRCTW